MLRDRIVGRRDLAVAHADGQHEIDFLEGRLGGARALLAVAPADGQGVMIGNAPLPLTDVATGACSSSATAASEGPASTQPSPA